MASNRGGYDTQVGTWQLPVRGVQQQVPAHQLPPDAFYDALNVCLRSGALVTRPCLKPFTSGALTSRVTGAFQYTKADGSRIPVAGTTTDMMQFPVDGPNWVSIKGSATITGSATDLYHFTTLTFGTPGVNYLVMANGKDLPLQWGGAGNVVVISNAPPVFKDVTTSFERVVGLVGNNEVRWGEINSLTSWSELNSRFLSETPDASVAVKNIGTLGIVVYKQRSIWVGYAQGGPSSAAFRFELRAYIDGPAGSAAVIDANGSHFYMTVSGRVGMFDGNSHQWVADGIWPLIKADIASEYANRIVGAYDERESLVIFWYPRKVDSQGEATGMVVLNLPFPSANIPMFAAFPGLCARGVSAAVNIRLADNMDHILVFNSTGGTVNRSHILDFATRTDDSTAIAAFYQTGLVTNSNTDLASVSAELFFLRGLGLGSVKLNLVTSNTLSTRSGDIGFEDISVDLTEIPVKEYFGFSARARFFGLRIDYTPGSTVNPTWFGARLWGVYTR